MTQSPSPHQATATSASTFESRREFMERVLALLWPERAAVGSAVRRRPGSLWFAALPNAREPKALIPARPTAAAAAALAGYKASATWRMRAQLRILATAARFGGTAAWPYQVSIRPASEVGSLGIDDYLGDALGQQVYLALHIGPPRANRKPVLQVISGSGRTLAFAKIGINQLTDHLVRSEAAALRRLNEATFATLDVPRLLHHGQYTGHEIAVQSAMRGAASADQQLVGAAMLELASFGATGAEVAAQTSHWRRLRQQVETLPPSGSATAVQSAVRSLTGRAQRERIRLGAWHGDWTPWNMAVRGNRVALWDWERFEPDVPWGFDALHHHMQGSIIRSRQDPQAAAAALLEAAPQLLAPFGLSSSAAEFTVLTYFISLAARYLGDDMAGAGGRLGSVERWLLPVLRERLAASEDSVPQP